MKNQKGQVILVLILVMTVALAIGISVIQRSISDISTASKIEQSSRAFSAAEAGIEKALVTGNTAFTLPNNAQAQATDTGLIPAVAPNGTQQIPLEYPPLSREEVAQVLLADPEVNLPTCTASNICYKQPTLDVYWGNSSSDKAALELTLVYYEAGEYKSKKWFLDQMVRSPDNHFDTSSNCAGGFMMPINYQCKKTLGDSSGINNLPLPTTGMMLLRARLLYNTASQPFAVQAVGICGRNCSIPPQARIITSIGTAGTTQREVQLFQINKVVPPYFDYAIFSTGEINK